jgi:peptide/nickel transport system substrate-binding protein
MTQFDKTKMHPAALMYANEEKAGKLSRREFLTRTTSLGLTATAAYGLVLLRLLRLRPTHSKAAKSASR